MIELGKKQTLEIVKKVEFGVYLAEEAGSAKAVNIVLMGKASKYFNISYESWIKAIENTVAPKFVEMNKKAFLLGRNAE